MPAIYTFSTTAQSILDEVSVDVRRQLSSTDPNDQAVILSYLNRIHLETLRASKWRFLDGSTSFVTQRGVANYWLGPVGDAPISVLDTKLDLGDIKSFKKVFDYSNLVELEYVKRDPLLGFITAPDGTQRPGKPLQWSNPLDKPIISLSPNPDNKNNYAPVSTPPVVTSVIGGSLPARTYRISTTIIDSQGNESLPSDPTELFVPAGFTAQVFPPFLAVQTNGIGVTYSAYNVYAAVDTETGEFNFNTDDLKLQTVPSIPMPAFFWGEPPTGLVDGPPPPTDSDIEPIDGYLLIVEYRKKIVPISTTSTVLQVPDEYKDVIIAGVNAYTLRFLGRVDEATTQYGMFRDGIRQIIRDLNFDRSDVDYIAIDKAAVTGNFPAVDTIENFFR